MLLTTTRLLLTLCLTATTLTLPTTAAAWQQRGYYPYYPPAPVRNYPPPYPPAAYPANYYYAPGYYAPRWHRPPAARGPQHQAEVPPPGNGKTTPKVERQADQDIASTKKHFVEKLLPTINRENARITQARRQLLKLVRGLDAGYPVSQASAQWLQSMANKYRVRDDPLEQEQARAQLVEKIDVIPASLALAQAANESAWGRSRFAVEANNLFGIWTYDPDKGLKPKQRDAQKNHLVRKFEQAGDSIKHYMSMLNSHPAYQKMREIRARARRDGNRPSGMEMAEGLEKYSARGTQYIELIQQLIRQNQWAALDRTNSG